MPIAQLTTQDSKEMLENVTSLHEISLGPWETFNEPLRHLTFDRTVWLPDDFEQTPLPTIIPAVHELRPEHQLMEEIMQLEREQTELAEHIRMLHQAHHQLDQTRSELMRVLIDLGGDDEDILNDIHHFVHEPAPLTVQVLDDDSEEEEEDIEDDEEEEYALDYVEEIGLGLLNAVISTSNGARETVRDEVFVFLDANGEECNGFLETMQRAVGIVNSKTMKVLEIMDENGNEMEEAIDQPIKFFDR